MTGNIYNVLFLCTGNSARSIIAEAILNREGKGRFRAYSAGSQPTGAVHPDALAILTEMSHPTDLLRSKSWDEFAKPGASVIDFLFTVCDNAAGEVCPIWPGRPVTAHWGVPDPAAVADAHRRLAFARTYRLLFGRISAFVGLSLDGVDRLALGRRLDRIGRQDFEDDGA